MTERLIGVGIRYWDELEGHTAGHGGASLRSVSPSRFCSLVWWWITRNAESEADVDRLRERVWLPPKGEEGAGVWSAEAETEALTGLMTDLGIDD